MSARRVSLRRLMWAGYNGGSVLKGVEPPRVKAALERRFDVVTRRTGGYLDFEMRCYEPGGSQRLTVRYGWVGNCWKYQPVAVCQPQPRRNPGDVVYRSDGSYTVAA